MIGSILLKRIFTFIETIRIFTVIGNIQYFIIWWWFVSNLWRRNLRIFVLGSLRRNPYWWLLVLRRLRKMAVFKVFVFRDLFWLSIFRIERLLFVIALDIWIICRLIGFDLFLISVFWKLWIVLASHTTGFFCIWVWYL